MGWQGLITDHREEETHDLASTTFFQKGGRNRKPFSSRRGDIGKERTGRGNNHSDVYYDLPTPLRIKIMGDGY